MRRGRRWKEHAHYPQLDCFLRDVSNKGLKCHIICPRFLFLSLPAMKQIWNPTRSQRESWHPHDCFAVDRPISTSSPEWMLFCCLGNRCVRPFRDTQIIMSYLWKISYMLILVLLLLLVSFIWSFEIKLGFQKETPTAGGNRTGPRASSVISTTHQDKLFGVGKPSLF